MNTDEIFLSRAIELARQGSQLGHGGPFGALVVRNGEILGIGWNRVIADNDPTAHAEICAIRAACRQIGSFHLHGATLYASGEPCPMCLAAAYWARIDQVVYANSRDQAAAIGFCDDELYAELGKGHDERRMRMVHLPLPEALKPLQDWLANPLRRDY